MIRKFKFRHALPLVSFALTALLAAGCGPQRETQAEAANPGTGEFRDVANAILGNGAEIIAQGDLARNGSEQLLVINRLGKAARASGDGKDDPGSIPITRAVIMEKNSGKWNEVLRCDEQLKNPRGYLDGTRDLRVTGWLLRFWAGTPQGIDLQFTPLGTNSAAIEVQWNANVKRYQSLDRIHKKFVGEDAALEPAPSILKLN